ncbi:MAG TPA: aminopeptidase P family protein [Aestuariivirgaceae bacterium]|nr:aminopeptidase P family protein [Aestuariivirgaceae bacterium]
MFQSFDDARNGQASGPRLDRLRETLAGLGLDGWLVPRADEFQGEYVAPGAERLAWLTGFTGSAGLAIVLKHRAAVFADGRYTIQLAGQIDSELFEPRHLIDHPPAQWLEETLKGGEVVGYDPWLVTAEQASRFEAACGKAGAILKPVDENPIDRVWSDRPPPPMGPVEVYPGELAGRSCGEKLGEVRNAIAKAGADAAVLSLSDSIAWLFNIRGRDIPHTPVVHAYAIVHREGRADLYLHPGKLTKPAAAQLATVADVHPPDGFEAALSGLGASGAGVLIDPASAPERVRSAVAESGGRVVAGADPCILPKARKTPAELAGARAAHRRDAVAVVRFLCWLDAEAPKGKLDEIAVVCRLEELRAEGGELRDISFDTIAGAGAHAAIPHYRVTSASNRPVERDAIVLIDSGGQYLDGTTDITRTIVVGSPTAEMRTRFTLVLKGMIAVSRLRFPPKTTGGHLDAFARHALWQAGLDYDHGTGHGVGAYLSVHEGPARLSKADRTALETGMILSNEPGYYREGHYGIRIENLVVVTEPGGIAGGERPMHGFETLTLAPIDRRLIDPGLLSAEEIDWLDAYHARVLAEIGPLVDPPVRRWLDQATAPLAR